MDRQSIDRIYWDAAQLSGNRQRRAFLDQACGGDIGLRQRVEELLAAQADAAEFLESPAVASSATQEPPVHEGPGTVIGPYKLLEPIGEGGFGIVFMAEQTAPVRRKVALKIIKPGMDTRQVVARFEAERQALALMDHANIAHVLDAGTTETGRPYFVMDLVYGVPITEFCDAQRLNPAERIELLVDVCRAVQHAHQKGIIHRDLKPSNILVTLHDDQAVPKIIDFGVAKAISQPLTEKTMFTAYGQMVGTPLYMSPEQAQLSGLDVDTRSDIYSLGVILYELLTGTTPFDEDTLKRAGFDEMRRMIREDEPPKPSSRLHTLATDRLSTISDRRRIEPRKLRQSCRGESDWIVMKCLEKDRNRRYETANGLATDLQRYLDDEPVEACPPSALYRLRKFARRNRTKLFAAGVVAVALVAGTVVSVSQAVRATQAEKLARTRLGEATEAQADAEANAQKARQAVNDMYTQVAEKWLAHEPQMEPLQREFLEKALTFYTEFAQETGSEVGVRLETARAYRRIADIQHRLGQPADAEEAYHEALGVLQHLVDEFPTVAEYRAELAAALHNLGVLLGDTGRYHEEEKLHRRALVLVENLAAEFATDTTYRRDLGRGHWFLGRVLASLHRRIEAEQSYRAALAIQSSLLAESPLDADLRHDLAKTYLGLGTALGQLGRFEEFYETLSSAAAILEELADEFPTLPVYRNELANVYYWHVHDWQKEMLPLEQSEQYLRRAIALQERLVAEYPSVTDYRYDWYRSHKTLGRMLSRRGRAEEAEEALRLAAATAQKLVAEAPTVHYYRGGLVYVQMSLGDLLTSANRLDEAEGAYRDAIRLLTTLVAESPDVPQYGRHLMQTYGKLQSVLSAAGGSP